MARYDHHTQRTRLFTSAWVTDTHDANLVVRGPKRFLSRRRAKWWAADERHSLETAAWRQKIREQLMDEAAA